MNEKKSYKIILPLVALIVMLSVLMVGCNNVQNQEETTVPTTEATEPTADPIAMEQQSLLLASGESAKLTVTGGSDITFTSSNTDVATVDADGTVKALKKGNALITVTSGDETLYCGVLVDSQGEMIDMSDMAATTVLANVQMYHENEIIGFAADAKTNTYYFSQQYANSAYKYVVSDIIVTQIAQVNGTWQRNEYVHLYNHGYGYFGLDREGDTLNILTESSGEHINYGTTISYAEWENKAMYEETFGMTWDVSELNGTIGFRPQSDEENGMIVVYVNGMNTNYYAVYDRESLLSGEEPHCLHTFRCEPGQTPAAGVDDSNGTYSSAIRGFAVHDGYIYQLSGNMNVYLSVFDFEGNLQYCKLIEGDTQGNEYTPGNVSISNGEIYVAVSSYESSSLYLATVWKLEEVK